MLIGKCPDCHHLSINWLVKKRLAIATRSLAFGELLLPATDQNEKGSAINKKKNATNPRRTTGSKEKLFKRKSTIDESVKRLLKEPVYLLACFNKKPPPIIDIKTGDQAAKKGVNNPLTPRELKLKLKI